MREPPRVASVPSAVADSSRIGEPAADVELESVPADWGLSLTKYRYVYSGDRVCSLQPFKSNWLRNLSAIVSIMSRRSASCGPSVMTTTFQEYRRADSSSARVLFCRLLKRPFTGLRRRGPPPSGIRAGPRLKSGREPLAVRYRRRGGPPSQDWCWDNVPTEYRSNSGRNVPAHLLVSFYLDVSR
jgi:hypothetical protein